MFTCSAFIAAIFYLIPNFNPFFPPGKRAFAYRANFYWQIFFGYSFCHISGVA
jgi:hypothetical protein